MRKQWQQGGQDRRTFLKGLAGLGGAALVAGCAPGAMRAVGQQGLLEGLPIPGRDRAGIQLFTVRDLTPKDYEGTLVQLRQIGYREVEPINYGTYSPQEFRAMLDRVGLVSPSTHANLVAGPDLERQLAGYQVIGHRYARANEAPRPGAPTGPPVAGAPRTPPPPATVEMWKRTAALWNQIGETGKKYGIKVMVHNHTMEFGPLQGSPNPASPLRPIDILLTETDPELVVFELDVGWSSVAGADALALFRRAPGRFPLWHIKDVIGFASLPAQMNMADRQAAVKMARFGEGDIKWKEIFAQARLAGLQHYFVEVEGEALGPSSMEASRASYQNIQRILT
jgi:sugar phosphate isomerase/epimerase